MRGERAAALPGEAIETPVALAGLFDPPPGDQAAVFEPQQGWVECGQRKGQASARSCFDQLADLVAMPRPCFQERQDQHLCAPLLQFRTEHNASLYVGTRSIGQREAAWKWNRRSGNHAVAS